MLGIEGDIQARGINGSYDVTNNRGADINGQLGLSWLSTIRGRGGTVSSCADAHMVRIGANCQFGW